MICHHTIPKCHKQKRNRTKQQKQQNKTSCKTSSNSIVITVGVKCKRKKCHRHKSVDRQRRETHGSITHIVNSKNMHKPTNIDQQIIQIEKNSKQWFINCTALFFVFGRFLQHIDLDIHGIHQLCAFSIHPGPIDQSAPDLQSSCQSLEVCPLEAVHR